MMRFLSPFLLCPRAWFLSQLSTTRTEAIGAARRPTIAAPGRATAKQHTPSLSRRRLEVIMVVCYIFPLRLIPPPPFLSTLSRTRPLPFSLPPS